MKNPGPLPQPRDHYDRRWAFGLTETLDRFFRSLPGVLEAQSLLVSLAGRRVKVTEVTAATYTILLTDDVIDVNFAGAVTLTLPLNPGRGQRFYVQDDSGAAASNNITVNPPGGINLNGGSGGLVLSANYGRLHFIYNGTQYIGA